MEEYSGGVGWPEANLHVLAEVLVVTFGHEFVAPSGTFSLCWS